MKKAIKFLAVVLALTLVLSSFSLLTSSIDFRGDDSYFKNNHANLGDGDETSFVYTSVFYRNAGTAESPDWVPTKVAAPGEEVRARVTLQTDFPTAAQILIAIWDSEMFSDNLSSADKVALPVNKDPNSYAAKYLDTSITTTFYTAYDNGSTYWDDLALFDNTDTEKYITEEIHDKYVNSWAYIQVTNDAYVGPVVNPGTEWLFEIPLVVKEGADLTADSGSFMIVADAWSSYDIDPDTDYAPTIIAGVQKTEDGWAADMGFWYDYFGKEPHFDIRDAQLSTSNTVYFDANGGTLSKTSETGTVGGTVSVPTAVTAPEGKTTAGVKWSTSADTAYADAETLTTVSVGYETGDDAVTYYAIYDTAVAPTANYTVKYYKQNVTGDGYTYTGTDSDAVKSGDVGTAITAAMCAPASFDTGFEAGYIAPTDATIGADGDTVVSYYMNRVVNDVIFDANGGTFTETPDPVEYRYGAEISSTGIPVPTAPEHKTFVGWALSSTATEAADSLGNMGTSDITVYAVWANTNHNVTFNAGAHGSFGEDATTSKAVAYGDTITADTITAPTAETGYKFAGWSLSQNATAADASLGTMGDDDVTVYAAYTALKVNYDTYGSYDETATTAADMWAKNGRVSKETASKLAAADLNENAAEIPGFKLEGWSTTANVPGEGTAMTLPINVVGTDPTSTVKLYPVYSRESYLVTFDANGGSFGEGATTSKEVAYGAPITADTITAPTAETGKTFAGWALSSTATEAAASLGNMGTAPVTVYAVYEWIPYTVTYKIDGVQSGEVETYHFGEAITLRNAPVGDRTFDGWHVEELSAFPGTMPARNLTVYGNYQYEILYYAIDDGDDEYSNMGSDAGIYFAGQQVTFEDLEIDPDDFYRFGYTIEGWSLTEGGEALDDSDKITFGADDVKLYAVYSNPEIVLVFVCDYAGNTIDELEYTADLFEALEAPAEEPANVPDNAHFIGWAIATDELDPSYGEGAYDYSEEVITDFSDVIVDASVAPDYIIVLIAVYAVDEYELSYEVDYGDGNGFVPYGEAQTLGVGASITSQGTPAYIDADLAAAFSWQGWESEPATMPARNITVKGSFAPVAQPFKVTYVDAPTEAGVSNVDTTIVYGGDYEILAPAVSGYSTVVKVGGVETTTLKGKMPLGGITATVTYTAGGQTYRVTYSGAPEDKMPANINTTKATGASYEIAAPAIAGYDVEVKVNNAVATTLAGTVPAGGIIATVTYTAKAQTYKVTYTDAPAEAGVSDVDTTIVTDGTYTIAAPAVDGYDVEVKVNGVKATDLTGAMPAGGIEAEVTYTALPQTYKVTYTDAPAAAGVTDVDDEIVTDGTYTIAAPAVDGYDVEVKVNGDVTTTLAGAMPYGGIEAEVTYTALPQTYKVTYTDAPEAAGVTDVDDEIVTGGTYTIAAPAVEGYSVVVKVNGEETEDLTGKMPYGGLNVTVTYVAGGQTYKVTYVNAPESEDLENINTTKATGASYEIAAPAVDGYDVEVKVNGDVTTTLAGTVPAGGIEAVVTYTALPQTYKVTYTDAPAAAGVTDVDDEIVTDGTYTISAPAVDGYDVVVKVNGEETEDLTGAMPYGGIEAEVTYTALPQDYVVNYVKAPAAAGVSNISTTKATGESYTISAPAVDGYSVKVIVNGEKTEELTGNVPYGGITATVTYTAKAQTYKVTYTDAPAAAGVSDVDTTIVTDGTYTIAAPAVDGYDVVVKVNGEETEDLTGAMPAGGIEAEVTYTALPQTYKVTYTDAPEAAGVTDVDDEIVTGGTYTIAAPAVDGYDVEVKVNGDVTTTLAGAMPYGGLEVTVTYTANTATLTVNYVESGTGTPVKEAKVVPSTVGASYNESAPAVTGFTCSEAAKTGTVEAGGTTITFTYTRNTVTVSFNANGGEFVTGSDDDITAPYGSALTVPTVKYEGYEFAGWAPALTGTEGAYTMPAEATEYVAQWSNGTKTPYKVEVYQMNDAGAYVLATTIQGTDGETGITKVLTVTNAPEGYVLDTDNSVLSAQIKADGSTVFTIKYARPYTVTFDGETAYYPAGAQLVAPEAAAPAGQKFIGWSATEGATTPDTLPATVTESLVYYSVYAADTATITYYVNYLDGEGYVLAKTETGNIGADVPAYTPTLKGYTFTGWSKTVSTFTEDVELYGSFEKGGYSVTYVRNVPGNDTADGTVIAEYTGVAYGSAIPVPVEPGTVEYYNFIGYSYMNLGTATMPAQDLIIYANYERVPVKLIARAGSTTVIDRDNRDAEGYGIVYGLQTAAGAVVDEAALRNIFLDVEGDGSIVLTPADTFMGFGLYGTGTKVTVIDNVTGAPVEGESFYIVVFGDVNGDGIISADDTTMVKNFVSYTDEPENLAVALAADVDHNGRITPNDTSIVKANVASVEAINQVATLTAASFNAYEG